MTGSHQDPLLLAQDQETRRQLTLGMQELDTLIAQQTDTYTLQDKLNELLLLLENIQEKNTNDEQTIERMKALVYLIGNIALTQSAQLPQGSLNAVQLKLNTLQQFQDANTIFGEDTLPKKIEFSSSLAQEISRDIYSYIIELEKQQNFVLFYDYATKCLEILSANPIITNTADWLKIKKRLYNQRKISSSKLATILFHNQLIDEAERYITISVSLLPRLEGPLLKYEFRAEVLAATIAIQRENFAKAYKHFCKADHAYILMLKNKPADLSKMAFTSYAEQLTKKNNWQNAATHLRLMYHHHDNTAPPIVILDHLYAFSIPMTKFFQKKRIEEAMVILDFILLELFKLQGLREAGVHHYYQKQLFIMIPDVLMQYQEKIKLWSLVEPIAAVTTNVRNMFTEITERSTHLTDINNSSTNLIILLDSIGRELSLTKNFHFSLAVFKIARMICVCMNPVDDRVHTILNDINKKIETTERNMTTKSIKSKTKFASARPEAKSIFSSTIKDGLPLMEDKPSTKITKKK